MPDPGREKGQLRRIHLGNKGGLTLRASSGHMHRGTADEIADVEFPTTDAP